MKKALRFLPIVAAIGIAFWLGTLDGAKHRSQHASDTAATR